MWNWVKNLFRSKENKQNVEKFNEFKNLFKTYGIKSSDDYYIINVNKSHPLSDEQFNLIKKTNLTFDKTNCIVIEFIGYTISKDQVVLFVYNCQTGIYEWIILNSDIYNILDLNSLLKNKKRP